jgi:hypothetical protein
MEPNRSALDVQLSSSPSLAVLKRPRTDHMARTVAARAMRVGARRRLETELRAIAVDLLGPFESDELPPGLATWVDVTAERAVSAVCDESLAALIEALESRIMSAPPAFVESLDAVAARHDAGIV